MKEIIFVTHNKGKIASAQKHFDENEVKLVSYKYDLEEPRTDDIEKIAIAKVKEAYEIVKKPCIAMDSGFFIRALNGFPRAFVNFSLETIGIQGILKLMEDKEDRGAAFMECVAYYDGKIFKVFHGLCEGTISKEIVGIDRDKKWSDLWYIFIPDNCTKTLAQMNDEEREGRTRATNYKSSLEEFAKWFKSI